MLIYGIWESAFGSAARLRRVANLRLGWSLAAFGSDLARVDVVATPATFGSMCPGQVCAGVSELNSLQAPFDYAGLAVDGVLDLLRSAVLAAELGWNQVANMARAGAPARQVVAYTAGPSVQAAGYGWRTTYTGTYGGGGCQSCLWAQMGVKFGSGGLLQRIGADGWVRQESWSCVAVGAVYTLAPNRTRGNPGQYWVGSADECKTACIATAQCAGFTYNESSRACFFVAATAVGIAGATSLPAGSANMATLGAATIPASCYSRAMPVPSVPPDAAWTSCAGRCASFYAVPPIGSADLDQLTALADNVTLGATLEQQLEDVLYAANGHPRMQGIFMDALERWRRVAGPNGTVCLPPLYYKPGSWSFQGGFTKGVDNADFALRRTPIQQPAPKLQALVAWAAGAPQILPFTANSSSSPEAPCYPVCVWGVCVGAACECFPGYEGPDCSATSSTRPVNECQDPTTPVGVNLAGLSYWSTQWDYVDVFKKSGLGDTGPNQGWISQVFIRPGPKI